MGEGPVVHHYAKALVKALTGKRVQVEFGIRKLKGLKPSLRGIRVFRKNGRPCQLVETSLSSFARHDASHLHVPRARKNGDGENP